MRENEKKCEKTPEKDTEKAPEKKPEKKYEKKYEQMGYRVFVYLVYYFFNNIKDLNEAFWEKADVASRTHKKGLFGVRESKKEKEYMQELNDENGYVFQEKKSILGFARQRFYGIIHGDVAILEKDWKFWEEKFNITSWDYFKFKSEDSTQYNKKVLESSYEDWENFFYVAHHNKKELEDTDNSHIEQEIQNRLDKILKEIDHYMGTPVYNVFYYLCHNSTCSMGTNLDIAMDYLGRTSILEWNRIDDEKQNEYKRILEKHYKFIIMQREMRKIIMEDSRCREEMGI